jgi:hypothetical protein
MEYQVEYQVDSSFAALTAYRNIGHHRHFNGWRN